MADIRPEDFGAVPVASVKPEDFGAKPVGATAAQAAPAPNAAQDGLMEAAKGAPGGLMGMTASVGAMVTKALDDAIHHGAYNAGGHITDFLSKLGLSPEAAAGGGQVANVGLQALPAVAGMGIGRTVAPLMEAGAEKLMASALKPTLKDWRTGRADQAIGTMFDEGVNATRGGMETLRKRVFDIGDKVKGELAGSNATVDKGAVASRIQDAIAKIEKGNPTPQDMTQAAERVYNQFMQNGLVPRDIPVQQAQELKQGIYKILEDKYGARVGIDPGTVAAQKALARGFKEEISAAVPQIEALNARNSNLINALKVGERRALMDLNKNPMGFALLTHNPATLAAYMADKSALFKSIVARTMNAGAKEIPEGIGAAAGVGYSASQDQGQ